MKNYLENKYEEKFVVEESKIYNNGEKNTYHLAKAHPKKMKIVVLLLNGVKRI